MTTQVQYSFPKYFFIYDDYCKDEASKSEEILLYFWPEEISLEVSQHWNTRNTFQLTFSF
jgi:hypothetical protein